MTGLMIYDVRGRLVRTLVNQHKTAGEYSVTWRARDDRDVSVASGIYFVRLQSGARVETRKLVLLK
jgi:flagellar hook assembly protein FlgD